MEGFGEKSYQNLQDSVSKARSTNIIRLIYSLGIPNIGVANARMIAKAFDYDFDKVRHAAAEELSEIDGVGDVIAQAFTEYFADEGNKERIDTLLTEITLEKIETETSEQIFSGKTFVVTGSVEHFANRNELKALIESKGGKVTGSVTTKTDYLINNDTASNSSKNKKAKELSIPILSEEEFLAMI